MSTHDLNIANDTPPNVRSDLNLALAALGSLMSGTSDPSAMFAYELQARPDLGLLRRRNAANNAWVLHGTLAEAYLISRSSNTILGTANHGCTIVATSTFTQTFTAAATLTDGWWVEYRNDGSGVITLDPNSSEQIDGATTLKLYPGESCIIKCTGSAFKTVGLRGSAVVVKTFNRAHDGVSGDVSYTGVGFRARGGVFFAAINATRHISWGIATESLSAVVYDVQSVSGGYGVSTSGACILMDETTGSKSQAANLSTFDDDGWTLTWTRTGATSAATITGLALLWR